MTRQTGEGNEASGKLSPAVLIALIGLAGTIIAALLSSPLLSSLASNRPAADAPTVKIEGPNKAPLGEKTYFTFLSQNAVRAEWSIGGFSNDGNTVEPLTPSYQIFVEPSNAARVGDRFTLAVTVYQADGRSATETKEFTVVEK